MERKKLEKMTGKQMIKLYKKNSWKVRRISKGSHYQMEKDGNYETIPFHTKELKKGLNEYLLKRLREVK